MIVHLQIDDDLAEKYCQEAAARGLELPVVLVDRLRRAEPLDPRGRYVILEGQTREQMEGTLGGGQISSAEDLLTKVQRLARIRFGDHEIPLTAGQFEEIKWRAHKLGRTVPQVMEIIANKLKADVFEYAP